MYYSVADYLRVYPVQVNTCISVSSSLRRVLMIIMLPLA
jgi:hypothetical protein